MVDFHSLLLQPQVGEEIKLWRVVATGTLPD